jgi:hypothetical protein
VPRFSEFPWPDSKGLFHFPPFQNHHRKEISHAVVQKPFIYNQSLPRNRRFSATAVIMRSNHDKIIVGDLILWGDKLEVFGRTAAQHRAAGI